LLMAMIKST